MHVQFAIKTGRGIFRDGLARSCTWQSRMPYEDNFHIFLPVKPGPSAITHIAEPSTSAHSPNVVLRPSKFEIGFPPHVDRWDALADRLGHDYQI